MAVIGVGDVLGRIPAVGGDGVGGGVCGVFIRRVIAPHPGFPVNAVGGGGGGCGGVQVGEEHFLAGVVKVTEGDADESDRSDLVGVADEGVGGVSEEGGVVYGVGEGLGAGEGMEVGEFEFDVDGAGAAAIGAEPAEGGFERPVDGSVYFGSGGEVVGVGIFGTDGFRLGAGFDGGGVDATGAVPKAKTHGFSEAGLDFALGQVGEVGDGFDAHALEFDFGDRADSPEFTHRQGAEDVGFLIFGDDIEPVGFGHAGGDFGALLAGAHTNGRRQAGLQTNLCSKVIGPGCYVVRRGSAQACGFEESFVDADLFDSANVTGHQVEDTS